MPSLVKTVVRLAPLALLAFACKKAPPPAPPPTPSAEPVVVEPPPPPKACDKIEDACVATDTTRARIGASSLAFTPPVGWKWARYEDAAVARADDASMAITIAAKHTALALFTSFDLLVTRMELTPLNKKPQWWLKQGEAQTVGTLKFSMWEVSGGARGTKSGPLLIFTAMLPDRTELLGIGFVPADDKTNASEAILKAVSSIGAADAGAP
jgi:hypothetical protein